MGQCMSSIVESGRLYLLFDGASGQELVHKYALLLPISPHTCCSLNPHTHVNMGFIGNCTILTRLNRP